MPNPPTPVTCLGAGIGAVLDDMADLVTVVAGVLLLAAVPGNVPHAVTFVTTVFLLPALINKIVRAEINDAFILLTSRAKCPNRLHL